MISAMLPEELEEKRLQDMMQQAEDICACFHVQLIGGHTECSAALTMPVLTVTCVGKRAGDHTRNIRDIRPGQDVVISKWIGLEGSVRIAREYKEDLLTRYPSAMIEEAAAFERFLSVIPEAATAVKSGACGIHDVSQGGIFAALWELAHGADVGLEIDLRKLPVRQETIELCEFFDLNPYELLSGGCLSLRGIHFYLTDIFDPFSAVPDNAFLPHSKALCHFRQSFFPRPLRECLPSQAPEQGRFHLPPSLTGIRLTTVHTDSGVIWNRRKRIKYIS